MSRPSSPARRSLTRLRWRLTAAYTAIIVIGLAALSFLVLRTDARSGRAVEYDEMRRRAAVTASLIYYQDGRIQLDGLQDDEATTGNPQVTVVLRQFGSADRYRPVFSSRQARFAVPPARVAAVADAALAEDGTTTAAGVDEHGRALYLLATPFYEDGTDRLAGAVVVAGDPERGSAERHRLAVTLAAGCAVFTALGAAAGHALSGRSVRPAWQALEQQEQLLADAAHELRTPVAVLRGAMDLVAAAPADLPGHLPRLRRAADRMAEVTENLLARGRLQAGVDEPRREPVRLDQLVEAVCEELPAGPYRLRSRLAPVVAEVDPVLVRLAVRNLLDNAVRHGVTPGAGYAQVEVRVAGPVVTVADRGPGLEPAQRAAVFTRFHSPGGGTGIGLSLVRWVADAHGGEVAAGAREGGGAVFTLRLERPPARGWRGRSRAAGPPAGVLTDSS
ncbi:HAMP domain-containing sensor histidine kinase [Kitasatospora sp. NPDC049258]|uniref:sensor histidine kinase n=1 Tax=Kitasatospora sp. NPDC049258 TaxID=3155394 RepID=UPI003429D3A3